MRIDFGRTADAALICCLMVPSILLAEEAATDRPVLDPATLVKTALVSEVNGEPAERSALLQKALDRDPDFAPARWQSGFVHWDGQWLRPSEVPARVRGNDQLAAYRKLRDAMVDTADNQRELARWCRKNKLPDEERIHWAKVLEFDRQDAEALTALGLQLYNGQLLTRKQIDEEKKHVNDALRAAQTWRPQMVRWREAIEHGNTKQVDEAVRKVRALSDALALRPLESVFAGDIDTLKSRQLNALLIETAGRMPDRIATEVLLRRAIVPDAVDVRAAAALELKKRPMHAYVPILVASLPGAVKTKFRVQLLPNGTVIHEHEMFLEGSASDVRIVLESVMAPADLFSAAMVSLPTLNRELSAAQSIESGLQALQWKRAFLEDRIKFVLKRTTGFENVDNPELWIKAYNDYYGWNTPDNYKPTYTQTASRYQTYLQPMVKYTPPKPLPYHPPVPSKNLSWHPDSKYLKAVCFAAGTPVVTLFGSMPIEKIKAGDRVLAQDPETGELIFKPVQQTSLRVNGDLMQIRIGSETITATSGHPFWVAGRGWMTSRHLKSGDLLHGIEGSAAVESVDSAPPVEVYNLVVSDLHNFFVGQTALLVHDDSPLEYTGIPVPGLPAAEIEDVPIEPSQKTP